MEWQIVVSLISSVLLAMTTIVGTTWALAKQFANTRSSIFEKIDKTESTILTKLEYHERHDDARFSEVRNDIWEIRLQNAVKNGPPISNKKINPQTEGISG